MGPGPRVLPLGGLLTLHAKDLDPATRKRLGIQGATGKSRAGRQAAKEDGGCPYLCVPCGLEFPTFGGVAGWEAHSKATGHSMGRMVLP